MLDGSLSAAGEAVGLGAAETTFWLAPVVLDGNVDDPVGVAAPGVGEEDVLAVEIGAQPGISPLIWSSNHPCTPSSLKMFCAPLRCFASKYSIAASPELSPETHNQVCQ